MYINTGRDVTILLDRIHLPYSCGVLCSVDVRTFVVYLVYKCSY